MQQKCRDERDGRQRCRPYVEQQRLEQSPARYEQHALPRNARVRISIHSYVSNRNGGETYLVSPVPARLRTRVCEWLGESFGI